MTVWPTARQNAWVLAVLMFLTTSERPPLSTAYASGLIVCLTLIIGRFSRDYRELRFKNTIIPLP